MYVYVHINTGSNITDYIQYTQTEHTDGGEGQCCLTWTQEMSSFFKEERAA